MAKVDSSDLRLTGQGGFLPEMIKAVLERGLAGLPKMMGTRSAELRR